MQSQEVEEVEVGEEGVGERGLQAAEVEKPLVEASGRSSEEQCWRLSAGAQ